MSDELQVMNPDPKEREIEEIAAGFHAVYEDEATRYGYETRPESRVPWESLNPQLRGLMKQVIRRVVLPLLHTEQQRNPHSDISLAEYLDLRRITVSLRQKLDKHHRSDSTLEPEPTDEMCPICGEARG